MTKRKCKLVSPFQSIKRKSEMLPKSRRQKSFYTYRITKDSVKVISCLVEWLFDGGQLVDVIMSACV